ncbi:MAG: hypothetical protein HRF49_03950 [bacterium]
MVRLSSARFCSSWNVGVFGVVAMLALLASSVGASQITDVRVKGLSDRDLVIISTDKEMVQPDMVVQKLLPTRLEVVFSGFGSPELDLGALKSGLVNRLSLVRANGDLTLVVQLDHQGKANPEMFRWSNPRPNLCVLEIFHPTSDRSKLSDAMMGFESTPAGSEPTLPVEPAAVLESPVPDALQPSALVNDVSFNPATSELKINLSSPIEPLVKVGNFPPSLTVELPEAALSSRVPTFVTKYHGRILHITTREIARADGSTDASEVLIVFTNGTEPGFDVQKSANGSTVTIKLSGIETESAAVVPEPQPEPPAVETVVAPAVEESASVEESAAPVIETPAAPAFETPVAAETGFVTSVKYDSSTGTLSITTDEKSTVSATRENFPPGYRISVNKKLGKAVPGTVAKFQGSVRWISAATGSDASTTNIFVQFENGADWTLLSASDSGDGLNHSIVFGKAPVSAAAPALAEAIPAVEESVEEATAPSAELYELPAESAVSTPAESTYDGVIAPSVDELMGEAPAESSDNETVGEADYDDFPVYDLEQFRQREGEYELPEFEGMKDRLSDVLVTLPRAISIYSALTIMSQVSGISIILDPYWNMDPRGTGPTDRPPLDTLGPGGGFGGGGFREAGQFEAITFQEGLAVQGNFTDVPFDIALKILLDSNNLKMKVYRDESDPYAKPIVFVTSRERMEHELKDANEVELYQLHYADPNQIIQILWTMDILPSFNVGYYTYRGISGGNLGGQGQGGFGGSGGGTGRGGSGGGGSFRNASVDLSTAPAYFAEPMQGISPGSPGGGGGGAGGGQGQGGQGGIGGQGQGGVGGGIPLPTAKSGLIIMRGTRETLEIAKDIIRKVDKPPKQASLKVTIYTVTENPQTVYGLLTGQANRDRTFWDYGGGSLGLTIPAKGGIIPTDNYELTFNALQTERKAKVINQTEIAVIDGLPANIEFNRTRGNFRTTVTFDANGNAFRTGTFDEVTADTSLDFLPQIDDYGRITLQFQPDVTVFDGPPQVAQDGQGGEVTFQPTTTTTLNTVLRLQDGETALIGGLMIETDSDDIEKVPLLGDIPFIGSIFSHHNKSRETSYIFVTISATIIDDK